MEVAFIIIAPLGILVGGFILMERVLFAFSWVVESIVAVFRGFRA
jgi:hypothetical protein